MNEIARILLCVTLAAPLAAAAFAQQPPPASGVAATQAVEFEPTPPYAERAAARGPVLALSARDVVERALRSNLDLMIERYTQQLSRQRVVAAQSFYDPAVSLATTVNSATNPVLTSALLGAAAIPSETVDTSGFGPALRQNLPGGGNVAAALTSNRTRTTSASALMNPAFSSLFSLAVTQPLLRGFVRTLAERQISVFRLDEEIALSQYRQRATAVLQQALNQYWELVFAIESYEARRRSKDVALLQYESTSIRAQNGLVAPVALTAARAEIASRERDILQAEVQIIAAENALKQLLSSDPASPLWDTSLVPTDRPDVDAEPLTFQQALALAQQRRPEVQQLRLQASQNRVDTAFLRWEKLPTVSVTANLAAVGRSGTVLRRTPEGTAIDAANPALGGLHRTFRQVFDFDFPAWSVGINVQVPLRNRSAAAQYEQARLAGARLATQMTRTVQALSAEARNAVQTIATQRKSLEAARLTAQLFEEQLQAQTARYESGFSTEFELLRHQRDLVDARVRELRALIDLQISLIGLQKATDTLLDALGVDLASLTVTR